jgi:hypothetical protein
VWYDSPIQATVQVPVSFITHGPITLVNNHNPITLVYHNSLTPYINYEQAYLNSENVINNQSVIISEKDQIINQLNFSLSEKDTQISSQVSELESLNAEVSKITADKDKIYQDYLGETVKVYNLEQSNALLNMQLTNAKEDLYYYMERAVIDIQIPSKVINKEVTIVSSNSFKVSAIDNSPGSLNIRIGPDIVTLTYSNDLPIQDSNYRVNPLFQNSGGVTFYFLSNKYNITGTFSA